MADFKTHLVVGAGVGALGYLFWKIIRKEPITPLGLIASISTCSLIATLPDQIEYAYHPNHRAIFHSLIAGGIMEEIARRRLKNPMLSSSEKTFWLIFALGYGSHLFLDALTPKGLPILTK